MMVMVILFNQDSWKWRVSFVSYSVCDGVESDSYVESELILWSDSHYVDVVAVGGDGNCDGDGDSDSNVESEDIQWSDCGGNATMVLMLGPRHRWTPSEISIHRQKLDEGDDDGEELRFFLKLS